MDCPSQVREDDLWLGTTAPCCPLESLGMGFLTPATTGVGLVP